MARPRKDQTDQADTAEPTAEPRVSVMARRLKHPFGAHSRGIPLSARRRDCVVRVFTADQEHQDRHFKAIHDLGWQPCLVEDLAVKPESIGYAVNEAGYIVRGTRGQDMLMWMPEADWQRLCRAKSDANTARVKSTAVRQEVAQATAKEFQSDQAGEAVYSHFEQKESVGPLDAA